MVLSMKAEKKRLHEAANVLLEQKRQILDAIQTEEQKMVQIDAQLGLLWSQIRGIEEAERAALIEKRLAKGEVKITESSAGVWFESKKFSRKCLVSQNNTDSPWSVTCTARIYEKSDLPKSKRILDHVYSMTTGFNLEEEAKKYAAEWCVAVYTK